MGEVKGSMVVNEFCFEVNLHAVIDQANVDICRQFSLGSKINSHCYSVVMLLIGKGLGVACPYVLLT